MLHDELKKFGGIVDIELIRDGANGPEVIQRRQVHNTVVAAGKLALVRLASGLQTKVFDQFRIGTSGATVASNQTNLLSPVTGTLVTGAPTPTIVGTRTLQLVVSYPSGAGSKSATNIQEVVVMNQNTSPGGSCLMRAVFTALDKTTSDKLKIVYSLKIT